MGFIREQSFLTKEEQDLILANLNPNTHFNKFDIPTILDKVLDKFDLEYFTIKITFHTTRYFKINSKAVATKSNKLLAQKNITTVIKIFDIYKDTTQEDFIKGNFSPELTTYPEPRYKNYKPNKYSYKTDGYVMLKPYHTF